MEFAHEVVGDLGARWQGVAADLEVGVGGRGCGEGGHRSAPVAVMVPMRRGALRSAYWMLTRRAGFGWRGLR